MGFIRKLAATEVGLLKGDARAEYREVRRQIDAEGFVRRSGMKTRRPQKRRSGCAGINRQKAEDARSSRERSSDPLGPEFCVGHREVTSEA
jgi:hypothetical protein